MKKDWTPVLIVLLAILLSLPILISSVSENTRVYRMKMNPEEFIVNHDNGKKYKLIGIEPLTLLPCHEHDPNSMAVAVDCPGDKEEFDNCFPDRPANPGEIRETGIPYEPGYCWCTDGNIPYNLERVKCEESHAN